MEQQPPQTPHTPPIWTQYGQQPPPQQPPTWHQMNYRPPLPPPPKPLVPLAYRGKPVSDWWLIGLTTLFFVLLCGACGTGYMVAIAGNTNTSASATSATATAQQPQPTATDTPDPRIADYRAYVRQQLTTLKDDFTAISDLCQSDKSYSTCRDAVLVAHDDVASFLHGLDAHPAPLCMATTDKSLRAALADYKRGTQLVLDGIDQYDVSKIDQGSAAIRKGTTEITAATDAMPSIC